MSSKPSAVLLPLDTGTRTSTTSTESVPLPIGPASTCCSPSSPRAPTASSRRVAKSGIGGQVMLPQHSSKATCRIQSEHAFVLETALRRHRLFDEMLEGAPLPREDQHLRTEQRSSAVEPHGPKTTQGDRVPPTLFQPHGPP